MTSDLDAAAQRSTARQSAIAISIVLLVVLWAGHYLLDFFGINIPALETAGGIIVLGLGLSMLHSQKSGQSHSAEETAAASEKDSVAVVPIAIPIVAGPGAITSSAG
jgi:multiple antibiotic resistance protein